MHRILKKVLRYKQVNNFLWERLAASIDALKHMRFRLVERKQLSTNLNISI